MLTQKAHSFIELGDNGVNISWVEDLLTQAEKSVLTAVSNPCGRKAPP